MKKHIGSVLLILCMLLGLVTAFSLPAVATTASGDYILVLSDGKGYRNEVSEENQLDLSDLNISYNAQEGYIFNGVNVTTSLKTAIEIKDAAATILLKDGSTNTVVLQSSSGGAYNIPYGTGILAQGDLTITGSGSLKVSVMADTTAQSYAIKVGEDLTVNGGVITATVGAASKYSYGIYTAMKATFTGGEVNATGGAASQNSYGIYIGGAAAFCGGEVNATGGVSGMQSDGIYAYENLTVSGGSLTATASEITGDANFGNSLGLSCSKLSYTGGTLIASSTATNVKGYGGVYAHSGISVTPQAYVYTGAEGATAVLDPTWTTTTNKTITPAYFKIIDTADFTIYLHEGAVYANSAYTAKLTKLGIFGSGDAQNGYTYIFDGVDFSTTASTAMIATDSNTTIQLLAESSVVCENAKLNEASYGLLTQGNLTVTGTGSLNVSVLKGNLENRAIYVGYGSENGNFTVNSGKITATVENTTALNYSSGIYVAKAAIFNGGIVEAIGGTSTTRSSYGIYINHDMKIGGTAQVKAIGGTGVNVSCGLYVHHETTVNGGTIQATGDQATTYSYGIFFIGKATVSGGTIEAKGKDAPSSCGIYAGDEASFSGGTVTAVGGKNVNISYGIHATKNLTVSDNAQITAEADQATNFSYAISVNQTAAFNGGSVEATGGEAGYYSCGIYAWNGSITVSDGTVKATGGTAYDSCGIYAWNGSITVSGGSVEATGGEVENDSYGMYVEGSVTVSDGTVKATGGEADNISVGVYAGGSITVSGGSVEATGGTAEYYSDGMAAEIDILISDGTVKATGGTAGSYSYGIDAGDAVTVSGGSVEATGGEARNYSCGIYVEDGSITVSGGSVEAIGGMAEYYSDGMAAEIDILISDGTVTAVGGTATVCDSSGIYTSQGSVIISGGTVKATGGTAEYYSYGIDAGDAVEITGSTVTVTSGIAGNDSYGISSYFDFITITDSDVTVTSGTAGDDSYGINVGDALKITGSTVTVISGIAGNDSYGISSYFDVITITDSDVTVTSGTAGDDSYGIDVGDALKITGSTVIVTSGTAEEESYGIYANAGCVTVVDSTLTASGNTNAFNIAPITAGYTYAYEVKADTVTDGANAWTLSGWRGNGSDVVSDHRYLHICEKTSVPVPIIYRNECFATTTGLFEDVAYFGRAAKAGDIVTLKVSLSDLGEQYGLDYRKITVIYETEGALQVGVTYDYNNNPIYKDGMATEFMLNEGFNKIVAHIYYNGYDAGTFEPFYCYI